MHRPMRSAQDVDAIDLDRIDYANRPDDLRIGNEIAVYLFAPFGQELLRVIQALVFELLRQDHRGGDDRPRQRTATGFVNPDDAGETEGANLSFMTKPAAPVHALRR